MSPAPSRTRCSLRRPVLFGERQLPLHNLRDAVDGYNGMSDSNQTTGTHEDEIVNRKLDPDRENPGVQIAEVVAELEGVDPAELTTMYGCIDGVLDHVFSDPPSQEAQLVVEFTYEGYRITIEQDGTARIVQVA